MIIYTIEGDSIQSYPDLLNFLREENIYDDFVEKRKIKMVGIYLFYDGSLWYGFPKYFNWESMPSQEEIKKLKTISKVIEKLRSEGKNLFEGDHIFSATKKESDKRKVNIIELSKFLIKDYFQNGIYKRTVSKYDFSTKGRVAWQRTISKEIPIISDENIIYDRPWKKVTYEEDNFVSKIHAYIITKAIDVYRRFVGECHITLPEIPKKEEKLKQYVEPLNRELLITFSDRENTLLKALIAWCDLTYNYRLAGCTNCFHNVWEWVNDEVFGNQKQNKESTVPTYHFYGEKETYLGRGTAKPDSIYFKEEKDKCILFVYDSKYYISKFSKKWKEVYGYPPNSDIVKQVAYLKKIEESLKPLEVETKNIFLLPEISESELALIGQKKEKNELFTEIGYVLQADFNEMADNLKREEGIDVSSRSTKEEDRVYLYMVYCDPLYKMYLKNKKYTPK